MKKPDQARSAADDLATVRDFLRWAVSRFNAAALVYGQGTDNAFDEAAFLILETLHLPIDQLDPFLDARLTRDERLAVATIIDRRVTSRRPASYLTGSAYIQGIRFRVDDRVIVPRSYLGEMLAGEDNVLGGMAPFDDPRSVGRVLDLCTGSGCLAILAALRFPDAEVEATDISADALAVARANVADAGLAERIALHRGSLFDPLGDRTYDLVIANPPYVDAEAMAALPPEYRHEPAVALDGGPDGLAIVRRILAAAPRHLRPGGGLLCEIGRGKDRIEAAYPNLDFLWLDSETSSGEVFWIATESLAPPPPPRLAVDRRRPKRKAPAPGRRS